MRKASGLAQLPEQVLKHIEESPFIQIFTLEPHQWAVASAYMAQKGGNKSLTSATKNIAHLCPAGYDPNTDAQLIEFLTQFENLVRYARIFGEHFMLAEAQRNYLKAMAQNDPRGMLAWFDRMQAISEKHGAESKPENRKIHLPEDE